MLRRNPLKRIRRHVEQPPLPPPSEEENGEEAALPPTQNKQERNDEDQKKEEEKEKVSSTTEGRGAAGRGPGGPSSSCLTPKRDISLNETKTPEYRTQTRLTMKYDDLLLSQNIDPHCEVSWECISPDVVQRIHRDMQRTPNLDISKFLGMLTDVHEAPTSSSNYIDALLNARQNNVPCSKEVPQKRTLKSIQRNTNASKMEEMIQVLEMRIKTEAEVDMADDSMNPDPLEETIQQPHQATPSGSNQKHTISKRNLTKMCLPVISKPTSSSGTKTPPTPLNRSFKSSMLLNNEDTSWSDDDLFCDESFIAKVTQTSENKTRSQIEEHKSSPVREKLVITDKRVTRASCKSSTGSPVPPRPTRTPCKTSSTGPPVPPGPTRTSCKSSTSTGSSVPPGPTRASCKTSSTGPKYTDIIKHKDIVDAGNTDVKKHIQQIDTTNLLQDDLDLGFSDSDTDDLLSQLTEQEICGALTSSGKKVGAENLCCIEDITPRLSDAVPAVITVDCKTDTEKDSVIEKTPVDSYLEFLDISLDSCRKPSPKIKKSPYNFRRLKNNQKQLNNNNTSATCSSSASATCSSAASSTLLQDIAEDNSFDDDPFDDDPFDDDPFDDNPFDDKDDDMLRFAESMDQTDGVGGAKVPEAKSEVKKIYSFAAPAPPKHIDLKTKSLCTKEQIERKKREAFNRRKNLGAVTKGNMK